jgi:hypothetical protein
MYKPLLGALTSQRVVSEQKDDDLKSNELSAITNLDFVNSHRDFSKTTEKDLEEVFVVLRTRCTWSWTRAFEIRVKELHKKIMTLKDGSTAIFINPDKKRPEIKTTENEIQRLMTAPESWAMLTKERAFEFSEILRHFTLFAPFRGRPFVRLWLEALIPCFSRWILMSDSPESKESETLKNFLGAFGQPGIVVCLADKGATMLSTLKKSARSVEANGRGAVESYYWKRLAESDCGGAPGWGRLAEIKDNTLKLSQLDCVPKGWLSDASD